MTNFLNVLILVLVLVATIIIVVDIKGCKTTISNSIQASNKYYYNLLEPIINNVKINVRNYIDNMLKTVLNKFELLDANVIKSRDRIINILDTNQNNLNSTLKANHSSVISQFKNIEALHKDNSEVLASINKVVNDQTILKEMWMMQKEQQEQLNRIEEMIKGLPKPKIPTTRNRS